tara:strand:- start:18209 stop:18466 length:258 start_codon:yes stop_codon:yes gene_type:complete
MFEITLEIVQSAIIILLLWAVIRLSKQVLFLQKWVLYTDKQEAIRELATKNAERQKKALCLGWKPDPQSAPVTVCRYCRRTKEEH